jgi:isoaspartyl peptidase/L-asparaginase-like protein (Ntn-hydrolase superfamily)
MAEGIGAGAAANESIRGLTRLFGPDTAGIILLDSHGIPGISFNTRGMAVGYWGTGIEADARIVRREGLEEFSKRLLEKRGWK